MNRILLSSVICLALGLGLGFFLGPRFHPTVAVVESGHTAESGRIQNLLGDDFRDYERLKTLEEKYKKADEILGKVILLFLQDLGLRVNPDLIAKAKQDLLNPSEPSTASKENSSPLPESNSQPAPSPTKAADPIPAPTVAKWKAQEKNLEEIHSESEIADFLKKTAFEDPNTALKDFSSFSNKDGSLQLILGKFEGSARIVRAKGRIDNWGVSIELSAAMDGSKLKGRESIKLSKNGEVFSNSNGTGDLRSLRDTPGSKALVVKAGPSMYFQLYYLNGRDQFVGNIYNSDDDTDVSYRNIGTLVLNRYR